MGGALAYGIVGVGYIIEDKAEPDATMVKYLGRYHICERRTTEWKQIVAEVMNEEDANLFLQVIRNRKRSIEKAADTIVEAAWVVLAGLVEPCSECGCGGVGELRDALKDYEKVRKAQQLGKL